MATGWHDYCLIPGMQAIHKRHFADQEPHMIHRNAPYAFNATAAG